MEDQIEKQIGQHIAKRIAKFIAIGASGARPGENPA
jgi:hypothetical protein